MPSRGFLVSALAIVASLQTDCRPSAATSTNGASETATYRVLFLGNSYTFVGDVPGKVRDVGKALNPPAIIEVDSIVQGGITLHQLYDRADVHSRIGDGHWSHVVVQDQSTDPLRETDDFHKYARLFADEIRRAHAAPVLYETWARRDGDELYKNAWTGGTPAAMQAKLDQEYEAAAADTGASLAKVGDARAEALRRKVPAPLYIDDGSHPTAAGAYLAACVIVHTITGRAVSGAPAPAELSADVARALQAVADGSADAVRR